MTDGILIGKNTKEHLVVGLKEIREIIKATEIIKTIKLTKIKKSLRNLEHE